VYELEVTGHVGIWGYAGKLYRPGVYVVDDSTAEAARVHEGLIVREVAAPADPEAPEPAPVFYEQASDPPGTQPLTRRDVREGNAERFLCPVCNAEMRSKIGVRVHLTRAHPDYEEQAASEASSDAEPEAEAEADDDDDVVEEVVIDEGEE
jgi:hypothetical protein